MNLLSVLQDSARVGLFASALPVVVGLIRITARTPAFQYLWFWMVFGFALNFAMMGLADSGLRTATITQLTYPVFAGLGLLTVSRLFDARVVRRWCLVGGIGYFIFWGWRFLNREASADFSLYTGPVLWMMLTIAASATIGSRLSRAPSHILRDPVLIAGLAILVSYAPGAAIEPVSAALYNSHRELTLALWIGRTWLVIFGYLLFSLAFYWTIPHRCSLGSLSSAA